MTDPDRILQIVAEIEIAHFFITVNFSIVADTMPRHIEDFLRQKHDAILQGARGRKFIYQESGWRLIFTFFPTNQIVDERYALKNKVLMRQRKETE